VVAQQTKEETESWILKQAEVNAAGLTYTIEGDEFVSHMSFGPGAEIYGASAVQKAIPLSRVTHITYVRTEKYLSYSLMCSEACAYTLDEPETKQPKFLFEIYRKLDDGFPARMNKALLHLIKLHGGNAKITKQTPAKEAF
jgi:hypothetical protein